MFNLVNLKLKTVVLVSLSVICISYGVSANENDLVDIYTGKVKCKHKKPVSDREIFENVECEREIHAGISLLNVLYNKNLQLKNSIEEGKDKLKNEKNTLEYMKGIVDRQILELDKAEKLLEIEKDKLYKREKLIIKRESSLEASQNGANVALKALANNKDNKVIELVEANNKIKELQRIIDENGNNEIIEGVLSSLNSKINIAINTDYLDEIQRLQEEIERLELEKEGIPPEAINIINVLKTGGHAKWLLFDAEIIGFDETNKGIIGEYKKNVVEVKWEMLKEDVNEWKKDNPGRIDDLVLVMGDINGYETYIINDHIKYLGGGVNGLNHSFIYESEEDSVIKVGIKNHDLYKELKVENVVKADTLESLKYKLLSFLENIYKYLLLINGVLGALGISWLIKQLIGFWIKNKNEYKDKKISEEKNIFGSDVEKIHSNCIKSDNMKTLRAPFSSVRRKDRFIKSI